MRWATFESAGNCTIELREGLGVEVITEPVLRNAPGAALRTSNTIGSSDTMTMPSATREKLSLTIGTLPNRYPAPRQIAHPGQRARHVVERERRVRHLRDARHERHERAHDRHEPASTIALPPCRSKNSCARAMYAGLTQRPQRGSVARQLNHRVPAERPIGVVHRVAGDRRREQQHRGQREVRARRSRPARRRQRAASRRAGTASPPGPSRRTRSGTGSRRSRRRRSATSSNR